MSGSGSESGSIPPAGTWIPASGESGWANTSSRPSDRVTKAETLGRTPSSLSMINIMSDRHDHGRVGVKDFVGMENLTVRRDGATIPVTVAGEGPAAVFVPGLSGTQAQLGPLFAGLRRHLRLATFDHRGHGLSGEGGPYDYATFGADTAAVLAALGGADSLVLIGHSMGADLLVDQAAMLPQAPRGLILIDGGTPLSASLLTPEELEGMRQAMGSEEALELQRSQAGTPHQVALSGDDIFRLQDQIDQHRRTAAARFDRIDGPITMIMSESMAGTEGERALELNQAWRDAVDALASAQPSITVHRVPAGHDLVATHPDEVLELVVAALAAGQ